MTGPSQMLPPHQPQTLPSAEDEALKRNIDCVYFLASPLTCKKGAECDYRHSEIARVNPRDCYYWLNGNCLNPKCAFRHPPLEGMLSPQASAPSGPLTTFQTTPTPVSNAPHSSGKQAVPCIFFQKGFCLKGERCPFSHVPALANTTTKAPQGPIAAASFPEPSTIKKPFVGPEKCSAEPKAAEAYIPPKQMQVPLQAKPSLRTIPTKDESVIADYTPEYRQRTPPFANGDVISRPYHLQQVHTPEEYDTLTSKDTDEISREHSPGFDVLVDDDLRETGYYHDKDQYESRHMTPANDYNIDHSVNYKDLDSMVDLDHNLYGDQHRYDSFNRTREQYGRDQRRVSSERGSERRRYPRNDSPNRDGSDLRHRLSKHGKVNGLRSVVSHDLDRDGGDWSSRGVSDRLRGRIKLPGRSTSPLNERDGRHERERESERDNSWGRLQSGRVQDRIKGRVNEDLDDEGRGFRNPRTRDMHVNNVNFAGPKSLSELRGRKSIENNKQELPLGKRKYSENDASFEGPKPLSEILKRKRGDNSNEEGSTDESKASKEVGNDSNPKSADEQTLERNANDLEIEEGLIVEEDEVADQENEEAYGDEEGEYEYEQAEGEDYNEDENVEDDYVEEDDDGDDFAKKIGVMFS